MSIAFASKAWGGDYERFLSGALERKRAAIGYPFGYSFLVLNNGVPEGVTMACPTVRAEHTGNVYADGEFAAVEHAIGFDYLCFVQGDCVTQGGDWVTPAIRVLESEPDVVVVSPLSEVNTWHDKEGYDHYMSDQAWVVRVGDLFDPLIYTLEGTDPDYPNYAVDSFEAMVGRYLKHTKKKRKILTEFWTSHPTYA